MRATASPRLANLIVTTFSIGHSKLKSVVLDSVILSSAVRQCLPVMVAHLFVHRASLRYLADWCAGGKRWLRVAEVQVVAAPSAPQRVVGAVSPWRCTGLEPAQHNENIFQDTPHTCIGLAGMALELDQREESRRYRLIEAYRPP